MADKLTKTVTGSGRSAYYAEEVDDMVAALENELGLAIPFVKMAGYADNSGEEYTPLCQECESVFANHKDDCALNAWLERNEEKET